jgi:hypothetical protein
VYNGNSHWNDKESAVVTEKNIDAIVRTFFDAWAHPKSYAGGDVDETSGKYEDRLNARRITSLYAAEADIDWNGVKVDMTPAELDAAVRARVPFIANGYALKTQGREDGTTAIDVKGWITHDASRPFQDYGSYVPREGESPFAERLVINKDGLIREDLFRGGVTRIEDSAPAVFLASSPRDAPVATAERALLPSNRETYPEVDEFVRQLYATGAGYVSMGGESYTARRYSTKEAFKPFFLSGPAFFWGRPAYSNQMDNGTASPVSYTVVDWKLIDEREGRLTVQVRIQSYISTTSTATYYRDTLTLVPTEGSLRYKVADQQREQIPASGVS